ncbi:hypothetical protein AAG570_004103 [Ranatra chinensis]|uniref:Lipase domain-containing protein n=1 Tax=Ranatra chinensis TaxID=642074 RepID=A0ABD0Y362_9HEMI
MPCYPTASYNTWHVGWCTGRVVARLLGFADPEAEGGGRIGIGTDAHVAAYASNQFQTQTGRRFNRITGLDPALPFFATPKLGPKLDPTDADFVDVLHTNPGVFGKIEPAGHVDFYVNGVTIQPFCSSHKNPPLCSHMLAAKLFSESINSDIGIWGSPCQSFFQLMFGWCSYSPSNPDNAVMGEHANQR